MATPWGDTPPASMRGRGPVPVAATMIGALAVPDRVRVSGSFHTDPAASMTRSPGRSAKSRTLASDRQGCSAVTPPKRSSPFTAST
ncbi:hypothetical protein ACFOKF_19170 [Sphingobium rhizovicinum]|uniref:Uncharacterized protein n=1 Tax=Sphingobium rhizovicinum TaxID=432308 RepID=A0ABV7NIF4_9SPHN